MNCMENMKHLQGPTDLKTQVSKTLLLQSVLKEIYANSADLACEALPAYPIPNQHCVWNWPEFALAQCLSDVVAATVNSLLSEEAEPPFRGSPSHPALYIEDPSTRFEFLVSKAR